MKQRISSTIWNSENIAFPLKTALACKQYPEHNRGAAGWARQRSQPRSSPGTGEAVLLGFAVQLAPARLETSLRNRVS